MPTLFKILLGLLALAYLISPFDLIPDMFVPLLGWVDDGFLIGLLIYYLNYGRLPPIFNSRAKQPPPFTRGRDTQGARRSSHTQGQARNDPEPEQPGTDPLRSPHEILGVSRNATQKEIQAAYRAAVKKYHPDRVSHLGKEFQDLANKKFIEIKEAYQALTKE